MMKHCIIFGICFFCVYPLKAYDSFTAELLDINTDTRSNGMADAGGAFSGRAGGYWLNPASISGMSACSILLTHIQLFEGASLFHYVGGGGKVGKNISIALNGMFLSTSSIPEFQDFSNTSDLDVYAYLMQHAEGDLATGEFAANDLGITATFARVFKTRLDLGWQYFVVPLEVPVGMTFKYIHQRIGDYGSGSGTGVDIGTLLRIDARRLFGERDFLGFFGFGLAVKDVGGTVVTWDSNYESVRPYTTLFSCAYEQPLAIYRSTVNICYDYDFRYAEPRAGLEYVYAGILAARCGISPRSFTAGAGINMFGCSLDYAFNTHDFGNIHRISAGYRFGGDK